MPRKITEIRMLGNGTITVKYSDGGVTTVNILGNFLEAMFGTNELTPDTAIYLINHSEPISAGLWFEFKLTAEERKKDIFQIIKEADNGQSRNTH